MLQAARSSRIHGLYLRARPTLRQAVVMALPAPISPRRRIAVSGVPRSGTSWLAKALSLAPGVAYCYEPDRELAELGDDYMHRYLKHDADDGIVLKNVGRSLRGGVVGRYQIAELGLRELLSRPFGRTILVKWVWLNNSLDWIAARFPNLVVVQIIRHPVPQFLSWRQRGWDPGHHLKILLDQPDLMAGPLRDFAWVMGEAETYWERAGAFWGAMASMQLRAHRPGWVLREHEWYCQDAEHRIRSLIDHLGLEWDGRISEFLSEDRQREVGQGYGRRRDPKGEIRKWEKQISPSELAELEGVVGRFELPFYRGMDPEAFWSGTVAAR